MTWHETSIGDQCELVTKGTTPTTIGGRFVESGINFIKVESLTDDGQILLDKVAYIDEETDALLRRSRIVEGDILFSIAGTIGRVARVEARHVPANTNQAVAIIRLSPDAELSRDFLYYTLKSTALVQQVAEGTVQAVQANFSLGNIKRLRVPLPPSDEQRAIVSVLGALDHKIALNRETNETLEAMARAIFKDWFVDFGPTRAKAEGREPYLSPDLWALFPDSLDDDDKPAGWEFASLSVFADVDPESWSTRDHPEAVRYVDLKNTKWGVIEEVQDFGWDDAPSRARRVLRPGDTIVGTVRPGNGAYSFIGIDGLTGSTGFAVMRPREQRNRALVYVAATDASNIDRLAHLADGAAYPAVRPHVVASTPVAVPGREIELAFSELVDPILARIEGAKAESHTLADLRDLLLPKLMSGEVRVKDAEAEVEAVA